MVTLITENGAEEQELMSKEEVAGVILDKIIGHDHICIFLL